MVNHSFPECRKTSDSITNIVAFSCHSLPIAAQKGAFIDLLGLGYWS